MSQEKHEFNILVLGSEEREQFCTASENVRVAIGCCSRTLQNAGDVFTVKLTTSSTYLKQVHPVFKAALTYNLGIAIDGIIIIANASMPTADFNILHELAMSMNVTNVRTIYSQKPVKAVADSIRFIPDRNVTSLKYPFKSNNIDNILLNSAIRIKALRKSRLVPPQIAEPIAELITHRVDITDILRKFPDHKIKIDFNTREIIVTSTTVIKL